MYFYTGIYMIVMHPVTEKDVARADYMDYKIRQVLKS